MLIKRNNVFIIFMILLILTSLTVFANPKEKRVIKVGYVENYGVFSGENSTYDAGYGYDYLKEIAKYTDWEYEFIQVEWSEGIKKLENGEIDIFGPMQKDSQREEIFDYPSREMGFEYGALYAHKDRDDIYYNDIDSINGMTIGAERNVFYNMRMEEYCEKNDISVDYKYTDISNFGEGVKTGEFDAFVCGSLMDIPDTAVIAKISVEPYYYATTKGNKEILDGLNNGIDKILQEDIYFASKLDQIYYGNRSINMPAFTREELNFIKNHSKFKVACDPSWAPNEYYDKHTGIYRGTNISIMNEIGKICGFAFDYLEAESYEKSKKMIQNKSADLILGYTNQGPNMLEVSYTDSFLDIPVVLVGRSDMDVNEDLVVAMRHLDSPVSEEIMKQYPHFEYIGFESSAKVMESVSMGDANAAFVSAYVFDELARAESPENYITLTTKINFPQSIGVSNAIDPIMINILNKAIKRLPPEQVSAIIFANTVNRAYVVPFSRTIKESSLLIIAVLAIFILAIVGIGNKNRKVLEKIAYVDSLTGIPTITKFRLDIGEILKRADSSQYMIVTMDIDNFKYINDSFGYESGNKVLLGIAEHFCENIEKDELIARVGADNFAFLGKVLGEAGLSSKVSIMSNVEKRIDDILPEHYNLLFSIGIYVIQDVKEDISIMLDKANFARKSVKGNNLSNMAEYTAKMDEETEWKKEITLSMEPSLLKREFEVYLQPKYLLIGERLIGAEALIRWNHPERGLLAPDMFISIFEQNGFIKKLDLFVFEQVCELLKKWEISGKNSTSITVSVNLSRLHLYNKHLVSDLLEITKKYDIYPKYIEIELTESIVFHNTDLLIEIMSGLRREGFKISIDDFGSGYSSLNVLKNLPVDVLKIDKEFLEESTDVKNGHVIIGSVTSMAKNLNIITVAEGVETKEQVDMLRDMGCDIAQGYYYSKPIKILEFEELQWSSIIATPYLKSI